MKKVLMLTHSPSSFIISLSKAIQKQGIEVWILTPHIPNLKLYEEPGAVKIRYFRYAPNKYERLSFKGKIHRLVSKSFLNKILFPFFMISFIWSAYILTRRESIDIIHAHWWIPSGIVALLVSKLLRRPYIVTTHGTDAYIIKKFTILKPLAKLIFWKANFMTTVATVHKSILTTYLGVTPNKIEVFPMAADISLFYPKPVKKRKESIILSIGNLIKTKGYEYLIEAVDLLKRKGRRFRLIIIGEGPEEYLLKNKIHSLELDREIKILPFMFKPELNKFYNLCDIFVLPSLSEGVSVVVLEALACKKPVVATAVGGMRDIIENEVTGLLVPEKDSIALVNAIERVLDDGNLAEKISTTGYKEVIENYTLLKIAERTVEIYNRILYKQYMPFYIRPSDI